MDTALKLEIIKTTLLRRGNGTTTPIRVITQFWDGSGTLLAEVDPCAVVVTPETVRDAKRIMSEAGHEDNEGLLSMLRQLG